MLKVITLFTGIGAQEAALKRLNIPFEVVGISEIDKYAIQSYEAINGPTFNYGDITKIPMLDYADLWTYSFPCQDLSVAGKQAGISEGTRSGLLLHVERLLETSVAFGNQPKYLLLENVKSLVSKKFKPDFDRWLQKLESLGYNNYWQVLNAKDYGVPQNRERVFVVSIRKDVDTKGYKFPEKIPLTRKLKDVLEPMVDEKYYLSQDKVDNLIMNMNVTDSTGAILSKCGTHLDKTTDVAVTLMARDYKGFGNQGTNGVIEPSALNPLKGKHLTDGILNNKFMTKRESLELLKQGEGSGNIPKIIQEPINLYPASGNPQAGRIYNAQGISPAVDSCSGGNRMPKIVDSYRIRKLTPLECWRLMDFTDEEFYAAQLSGVSNSQLYKQAGNSIVVAVLQAIFKNLLSIKTETDLFLGVIKDA